MVMINVRAMGKPTVTASRMSAKRPIGTAKGTQRRATLRRAGAVFAAAALCSEGVCMAGTPVWEPKAPPMHMFQAALCPNVADMSTMDGERSPTRGRGWRKGGEDVP